MRRRTGEGLSKIEVMRCLKRYVAREVFFVLQNTARTIWQFGLTSIVASFSLNTYPDIFPKLRQAVQYLDES